MLMTLQKGYVIHDGSFDLSTLALAQLCALMTILCGMLIGGPNLTSVKEPRYLASLA